MPFSTERFFLGHSLIMGNTPVKVKTDVLERIPLTVDMEKFGFFNTATPNFNSYYPDLDPADLEPEDKDYIFPTYRALSEIIINKYGPIDFSDNVLRPSMKKLLGQTVYPNHEDLIGNELGVVYEVFWGKAFKQNGIDIPAGINVRLKIDGKANPKLARSMQSDPPAVHSVSVSVTFKWKKSHEQLDDNDFWSRVGTFDDKGVLIRRIVEEVLSYEEISLVTHGADPYAQKINEKGEINNPEYAKGKTAKFSAQEYAKYGTHFDWKNLDTDRVQLKGDPTIPSNLNNNNNSTKTMNEELLKFLRLQLGLAEDASEAIVLAKLKENLPVLVKAKADLTTAETNLTNLKAKYPEGSVILNKEQQDKLAAYEELKKTSDAALTEIRGQALKLYHLSVGGADKADATVTKLISESTYETVKALAKQYETLVDSTHKLTCKSCGSTDVSRASAASPKPGIKHANEETEDEDDEEDEHSDLSADEVLARFTKPKHFTGGIHGTEKKKK